MTRKVFISESTNDNAQLELRFSSIGIHFDVEQLDGTFLASMQFTYDDVQEIIEELKMLSDYYEENNLEK
jgi:hypothetical protein